MFITAAPRLGVKTLPELIALARQRPGELAYGTNGPGRLTHLTGELLQSRAGIKLLMIPYSGGTAQVLNDVMGGRIPIAIDAYSGLAGAIEAGTVRPLAVASPKRVAAFPEPADRGGNPSRFRSRRLAGAGRAGRDAGHNRAEGERAI